MARRARSRICLSALVVVLFALIVPLVTSVEPAAAGPSWSEGTATAVDVQGRLVTLSNGGWYGSGFFPPNSLRAKRQTCPGCGWEDLGVVGAAWAGRPSLSLAADGRLEIIGWADASWGPTGADTIRVLAETCPGCGWPAGPGSPPAIEPFYGDPFPRQLPVPGPVASESRRGGVAAATNADGRRELFTTASDGQLWHTWEWAGGEWSDWAPLGGPPGDPLVSHAAPAASANADGRLEVFARAASGRLVHAWQWCSGGCGWSPWVAADGWPVADTAPGLGRNADGRLEVFAGVDDVLQHSWQVCPGCGWSRWVPVNGNPTMAANLVYPGASEATEYPPGPAVATNVDGRLEVFTQPVVATEHVWQVCAGCWWGATVPL